MPTITQLVLVTGNRHRRKREADHNSHNQFVILPHILQIVTFCAHGRRSRSESLNRYKAWRHWPANLPTVVNFRQVMSTLPPLEPLLSHLSEVENLSRSVIGRRDTHGGRWLGSEALAPKFVWRALSVPIREGRSLRQYKEYNEGRPDAPL